MFEVDRQGLKQLLERKGKAFALLELVQNAWDQNVTRVDITFTKAPGDRRAYIKVVDDDPDGFADIRHAYTLFASSAKKADATKRGRFNLGEKLVIAACEVSSITTTRGSVEFSGNERKPTRRKTERGSIFVGEMLMTRPEYDEACAVMHTLLPPPGIDTYFNGVLLDRRDPIATVSESLKTEIADEEGYLRPATRKSVVLIYEALPSEEGTLYEMGIPVVVTGDTYHIDVQQKLPLTMDRDNVPPSYLKAIHTLTLNAIADRLTLENVNATWVNEAMESKDVRPEVVRHVISTRFGDKAVIYDPSDVEANNRAVSAGYTVVHGGSLSKLMWENVRTAEALKPAGQVTPSPKAWDDDSDAPYKPIEPNATEAAIFMSLHCISEALLGFPIKIELVQTPKMLSQAAYSGRRMTFNKLRLRRGFFNDGLSEQVVDLALHELGHEFSSNHGSDEYNDALTRLGAKLAFLVRDNPNLLQLSKAA